MNYFAAACKRQRSCYDHGYRTYLKTAESCDADLSESLVARCEELCQDSSLFGKSCSLVSAEELAAKADAGFSAGLYETCRVLAQRMTDEAVATRGDRYPGQDRTTCLDYDGLGVSCAPATCTVTADKAEVMRGVPTDIEFTIVLSGSLFAADFDTTPVYRHENYALPIQRTFVVQETGRILEEGRDFAVLMTGPGGAGQCRTRVEVRQVSEPCALAVAPSSVTSGQLAGLTLVAGPGYNTAAVDVAQEGVLQAVTLQQPASDGTRQFFANLRPRASRTFTARVQNAAGDTHTCKAQVTVLP